MHRSKECEQGDQVTKISDAHTRGDSANTDGFHQVKLAEASSRLTTFWTPLDAFITYVCHLEYH